MAYEKTEWKNREVERPRTFQIQENQDGTVTLIPAEGQIIEAGTPINAANMNKIEQGIADAHDAIDDVANDLASHLAESTTDAHKISNIEGLQTELDKIGILTDLQTNEKSNLVDAINEVFLSGNNVKANTVGALLSVDPNLPLTSESSWNDIINAIGQISIGKKWAMGTGPSGVTGLDFTPSFVIGNGTGSYSTTVFMGFKDYNLRVISGLVEYNDNGLEQGTFARGNLQPNSNSVSTYLFGSSANNNRRIIRVDPDAVIWLSDGFDVKIENSISNWFAFE